MNDDGTYDREWCAQAAAWAAQAATEAETRARQLAPLATTPQHIHDEARTLHEFAEFYRSLARRPQALANAAIEPQEVWP